MVKKLVVSSVAVCWLFSAVIAEDRRSRPAILWVAPQSIPDRDLLYGQGGAERAPGEGPYVFEKEDMDGISPKFLVRDQNGVKWKVKVGDEAKPETVATRLVWAVGYVVDEDYFVPAQQVGNMPAQLRRGREFVSADGVVHNARWERMDRNKVDDWKWSKNPFKNTRELNGLRVLMALLNNWDVKRQQNALYESAEGDRYVVGDLGATFGPTGTAWPRYTAKGDYKRYGRSDFIKKVGSDYVDFASPSWPMMFGVIPVLPLPYATLAYPLTFVGVPIPVSPIEARQVGKHIPRKDVVWVAGLLKQLTPDQIRQAFQSAQYSPEEVEGFGKAVEARIQELAALQQ